jgi:hypothetical protein
VGDGGCASRRLGQHGTCAPDENRFLLGTSYSIEVILGNERNSDILLFTNFALYTQES